ncbi:HNH endonuclease [Antarcticibacterium flavum]|uniref:HNH endonuclease n=1 Tax=Antarcticibacterium flavum TaxID=2058175 RepID=A0A5B7X0E7_9FLAO|nr:MULTISPECIES: HNH endonuclease [Antarcticibacterium]MCM4161959.1 hypothetical protein [Antarcticibacterium sp. W02-3]QCY69054.1 HNH endonuclease [Antarcticibacterium flavum]
MSDIISKPYVWTIAEKQVIKDNFGNHNDWPKGIFNNLKEKLIDYLRIQQKNKCCYCKYDLGFDIKQVDIEHIVPKSRHERFTFEPLNLALSCPGCNTKKSVKPVLNTITVKYSKNSNNYKIVHAHFDNYSDHINIVNGCVFTANSAKGSETITYCELFRLSTVEEKIKATKGLETSTLESLVIDLKNASNEKKEELVKLLTNAIR